MSCNGCRVLRKGCSRTCVLRPCLEWIDSPQAQANATLFVSKFFGRTDLLFFISAVPVNKRSALFQSLLFEACGRTINPVNGAVGLLSTGNWHVCKAAVDTVLAGGSILPLSTGILTPNLNEEPSEAFLSDTWKLNTHSSKSPPSMHVPDHVNASQPSDLKIPPWKLMKDTVSFRCDVAESYGVGGDGRGGEGPKLLNFFG